MTKRQNERDKIYLKNNTICEKLNLAIGDGISFNGGVVEDSFIGLMIKRATKVQKV